MTVVLYFDGKVVDRKVRSEWTCMEFWR